MNKDHIFQEGGILKQAYERKALFSHAKKRPSPRITLRLTPEELNRLKILAGSMAMSTFVRKCVFGEEAAPRKVRGRTVVKDQQALARLLGLLGQSDIFSNLERLAQEADAGCLLIDEDTLCTINESCRHVRLMKRELMKALGLSEAEVP